MNKKIKAAIVQEMAYMDRLMVHGEFEELAQIAQDPDVPVGTRVYAKTNLKCCWSRIQRSGLARRYEKLID